jgi:hypothetical protein
MRAEESIRREEQEKARRAVQELEHKYADTVKTRLPKNPGGWSFRSPGRTD